MSAESNRPFAWRALRAFRRMLRERADRTACQLALAAARSGAEAGAARPAEPRSLFVLRNNDIGDLLVVTPLFEALRRRFPVADITIGVGSWNLPTLAANPHVSRVECVDAPWFNKYSEGDGTTSRLRYVYRSPQLRRLAPGGYDIGIDVLGSGWGALLLKRVGARYRIGVSGYAGGEAAMHAAVPFRTDEHVGRTALRLAELLGACELPAIRPQIFLTPEERAEGERSWSPSGYATRRPRVLVAPGGGNELRCWPRRHFGELLRYLGARRDLTAQVLAGPREQSWARELADSGGLQLAGEASGLREAFAVVAAADIVICNSSMALHAAAAFGHPTLVLLGEAFASASAHQRQWGYPGLSRSIGKEGASTGLPGPGDVIPLLSETVSAA